MSRGLPIVFPCVIRHPTMTPWFSPCVIRHPTRTPWCSRVPNDPTRTPWHPSPTTRLQRHIDVGHQVLVGYRTVDQHDARRGVPATQYQVPHRPWQPPVVCIVNDHDCARLEPAFRCVQIVECGTPRDVVLSRRDIKARCSATVSQSRYDLLQQACLPYRVADQNC